MRQLLNRIFKKKNYKKKNIPFKNVLIITAVKSIFLTGTLLLLFSVLLTFLSLPHMIIDSLALFALCVGIGYMSFSLSKALRKNGLFCGVLCSTGVYALLFVFSLIFGTLGAYPAHIIKFIIIALTGMIFGIVGVNTKLKNDFK